MIDNKLYDWNWFFLDSSAIKFEEDKQ